MFTSIVFSCFRNVREKIYEKPCSFLQIIRNSYFRAMLASYVTSMMMMVVFLTCLVILIGVSESVHRIRTVDPHSTYVCWNLLLCSFLLIIDCWWDMHVYWKEYRNIMTLIRSIGIFDTLDARQNQANSIIESHLKQWTTQEVGHYVGSYILWIVATFDILYVWHQMNDFHDFGHIGVQLMFWIWMGRFTLGKYYILLNFWWPIFVCGKQFEEVQPGEMDLNLRHRGVNPEILHVRTQEISFEDIQMSLSSSANNSDDLDEDEISINEESSLCPENTFGIEYACSICYEDYTKEDIIRRLRCGHIYHLNCVDTWFQRSSQCPMCKDDLNVESNI